MPNLTETDRDLITRARELGPALRASTGDRDRLAGWLLKELADLAERLGGSAAPVPAPGPVAEDDDPQPPWSDTDAYRRWEFRHRGSQNRLQP